MVGATAHVSAGTFETPRLCRDFSKGILGQYKSCIGLKLGIQVSNSPSVQHGKRGRQLLSLGPDTRNPPFSKEGPGLPALAAGRFALFGRWGDLCVGYDANSRP